MSVVETVKLYAGRWRNLRAWGRPLEEAQVAVRETPRGSSGLALPLQRACLIHVVSGDLADSLETVLHEYAHLAAPGDVGHAMPWRHRLAAAVEEVTGLHVPIEPGTSYFVIDAAAVDALRAWLRGDGLDLYGCTGLKSLPAGLRVGGYLYLGGSGVEGQYEVRDGKVVRT